MSLPVGNGTGVAEDRILADFGRNFASEGASAVSLLPSPKTSTSLTSTTTDGARPLGPSVQILPALTLEEGKPGWVEFTMTWMSVRRGFVQFGGVRVVLIEDVTGSEDGNGKEGGGEVGKPRVVKEWDVVAEMWVT